GSKLMDVAIEIGNRYFAQDAAGGALPTLYAATADLPGNTFAGPSRLGGTRGAPPPVGGRERRRDGPPPLAGLRAANRCAFPGNSKPVISLRTSACWTVRN